MNDEGDKSKNLPTMQPTHPLFSRAYPHRKRCAQHCPGEFRIPLHSFTLIIGDGITALQIYCVPTH
eukprot:6214049-Pleurochrysis_carterae.AAC.2